MTVVVKIGAWSKNGWLTLAAEMKADSESEAPGTLPFSEKQESYKEPYKES